MEWPTNQTFQHKTSYDDDTDDYGITQIMNRNFWEGKGAQKTVELPVTDSDGNITMVEETTSVMKKQAYDNYGWIVNDYDTSNIRPGCVISPFLHLRYVVKESLRLNRFFINRNDMLPASSLDWLKNLKIYTTFNIIDMLPTTEEVEVETFNHDTHAMDVNLVQKVTGKAWQLSTFNYSDLLPRKPFKQLLLGIQNFVNYVFRFRNDLLVDIIDRNEVLDRTPVDVSIHQVGKWQMGEQKNLILKFLPEYDKDDGKYDDEFKDLSDRWQDFGDPVEDMDELEAIVSPELGELRLVKERNEIYEYKWKTIEQNEIPTLSDQMDALGWEFVSTGPQPYLYGKDEGTEIEEIKSPISTLQTMFPTSSNPFGITPIAVQKGNINAMRSLWNDYTLRILPGNQIFYAKSLYWDGDQGIFKTRWEKWARFWRKRLDVTGRFNFQMNMVYHVAENIIEPFQSHDGNFIIEKMQVDFRLNSIGVTTINGYKI